METIPQRYDRLAAAFAAKIDAVPADRWDAPSACPGWKVIDIVRHVAETPGIFFGLIGRELGELPPVEEDPAKAFAESRARVQAALDDPAVAGTTFEGMFGTMSFAESIDRFISFDLVVHGWDLAHTTGLDEAIDPGDVRWLDELSQGFGEEAMRSPGAFGPAVEPPPDADDQTRVLAFLGRRAF